MRRLAIALGVMTAVLFVAGVRAQNTHNFSGTWTADADKNGPPPAATGGRGGRGGPASDFTITMDDKTMNVKTMRGQNESVASYKLDGSDSKNQPSMTMGRNGGSTADEISNAKWDGDKLVIVTKTANSSTTTSYWLEAGDLIRESLRPNRDGSAGTPTRTYFKKKM